MRWFEDDALLVEERKALESDVGMKRGDRVRDAADGGRSRSSSGSSTPGLTEKIEITLVKYVKYT